MADQPKHTDVGDGREHVSRAKDPAIVRESQKSISWISNIPRLVAIGIVLVSIAFWFRGCREEKDSQNTASDNRPPQTVVVERKVGKEKKSFRFFGRQCVVQEIRSDFEYYAFGGMDLSIEDPSGHVDTVKVGEDWRPRGTQVAKEENNYTFCDLRYPALLGDSIVIWAMWK